MSQPIALAQVLNLTGIPPTSIAFTTISLSSHTVCVRDQSNVHLLSLNGQKQTKAITAQSCLIHPSQLILALRSDNICQVVDLDKKEKVASTTLDVQYWEYVDTDIAMVSSSIVYLWNTNLTKVFEKQPQLQNCQYISFKRNISKKWMCLVGLNASDGTVKGIMQLYNVDKNVSQVIEGFCCTFTNLNQWDLFCFATKLPNMIKLHIIEIDHTDGPVFGKKQIDCPIQDPNDFPIGCQALNGLLYVFSKMGQFYLIDMESAQLLYLNNMSGGTIFTTMLLPDGILGVNRSGQVLKVNLNQEQCIPYILDKFGPDLALSIAKRCNLPGCEDLYVNKYKQLLQQDPLEAAKHAALSPKAILRTPQTIQQLKQTQSPNGNPLLVYFGTLLEQTQLNQMESIELSQRILAQNKQPLLEKWLKEDKLTCSEPLGDLIIKSDPLLALSVYLRCASHDKAIMCFAATHQYDKLKLYAQKMNITPNYSQLLMQLISVNVDKASQFCKTLLVDNLIDCHQVFELFQHHPQQCTALLLDQLKDTKENGNLQTRLLELNLRNAPQVADAILGNDMFHHFDHAYIAQCCEQSHLMARALEFYTDLKDIKRCLQSNQVPQEQIVQYMGRLPPQDCLSLLASLPQPLIVQIGLHYQDQLPSQQVLQLLQKEFHYMYLQGVLQSSQDPQLHFKYIQSCVQSNAMNECISYLKQSTCYDPTQVVAYLKQCKLKDLLPLVIVCDRFDLVHDLIVYLTKEKQFKTITLYCQTVNPSKTPLVIGALLDVDCPQDYIKSLLNPQLPIGQVIHQVEQRHQLQLLQPFLESLVTTTNTTDPDVHNALCKLYITTNNNAQQFLKTNEYYTPLLIGQVAEKSHPQLALIAYEKGRCDVEYATCALHHHLLKPLAQYAITRCSSELWELLLSSNTSTEESTGSPSTTGSVAKLIQQVIQCLPNCTSDQVSFTVKQFMQHGYQVELIELLYTLCTTTFKENKHLQNLLLMTAIQLHSSNLMLYLQLDHYDAPDIAELCLEQELYKEAFYIYERYDQLMMATTTLLRMNDRKGARQFVHSRQTTQSAQRESNDTTQEELKGAYKVLAQDALEQLDCIEALEYYCKSESFDDIEHVITVCHTKGLSSECRPYLELARQSPFNSPYIEEMYCTTLTINELQSYVHLPTLADLYKVGQHMLDSNQYEHAKIIYTSLLEYAQLSKTLCYLKEYSQALEMAKKANKITVYKELLVILLHQQEYGLAMQCTLQLIIYPDELDFIKQNYANNPMELIKCLQNALGLQQAHMPLFTLLSDLYCQYLVKELQSHLELFWSRMNIPTVVESCIRYSCWKEACYLLIKYEEIDRALVIMIEHPLAFDHVLVTQYSQQCNPSTLLKLMSWYLSYMPHLLPSLLQNCPYDHSILQLFIQSDNTPLIIDYCKQHKQCIDVLVELYLENEQIEELTQLLTSGTSSGTTGTSSTLSTTTLNTCLSYCQQHELMRMRQLSIQCLLLMKQYKEAIAIALQLKSYKQCVYIGVQSESIALVEQLLKDFCKLKRKDCFIGVLYSCFHYCRLDTVLELGWRSCWDDYLMPFRMQKMRDQQTHVNTIHIDDKDGSNGIGDAKTDN